MHRISRGRKGRSHRAVLALTLGASTLAATQVLADAATWVAPVDGNWTDTARWSVWPAYPKNGFPTADRTYQVTIDAVGSPYTVTLNAGGASGGSIDVDSLTLNSADVRVVSSTGTFRALSGLTINAGRFVLNGGTVKDTVISGALLSFAASYGRLDNVTVVGDVMGYESVNYGNPLTIVNGLTLSSASVASAPYVVFQGNQTISGDGIISKLWPDNWSVQSGLLTIAPNVTIHGGGSIFYNVGAGAILNKGVIRAETNAGLLTLGGGANPANVLTNQGLIEAVTGGQLEFAGAINNASGTIRASGGTILFSATTYKTANLGDLQVAGGSVGGSITLAGGLNNQGATLTATPTTGVLTIAGTVTGGTLASSGGSGFAVGRTGSIVNVMVAGDLSLIPPDLTNQGTLTFQNLNLTGAIHLKALPPSPGGQGALNAHFKGGSTAQTINGTGQILLEGTGDGNSIEPGGAALTLGAGITVKSVSGGATIGDTPFTTTNLGTILAAAQGRTIKLVNLTNQASISAITGGKLATSGIVNNGTIRIDAGFLTLGAPWKNTTGTISATNGSTITVNALPDSGNFGAFTLSGSTLNVATSVTTLQLGQVGLTNSTLALPAGGLIDNTGGTTNGAVLNLGDTNNLVINGGRINGGTVSGHILQFSGIGYLKGVTLGLPVNINNGSFMRVESGVSLSGAQVSLNSTTQANTGILFTDNGPLSGTGEIVFNGEMSNNIITPSTFLTIPTGITIRSGSQGGTIGASSATLTNNGLISSQTTGMTINVTAKLVNNLGTLEAKNGGTLAISALQNYGTVRVSLGGTATLTGNWFSSGPIFLDDGALLLGGNYSADSLAKIARSGSNSIISLSGNISNSGAIDLSATGPLLLNGNLSIGGGSISGSAGTSLSVSDPAITLSLRDVSNHVPLNLSKGASLLLAGNWSNTSTISLTDSNLTLDGAFTTAGMGRINRSGGVVTLRGLLANGGSLLLLDDLAGTWTVQGGVIVGGTVRTAGAARLYVPSDSQMTLDGVTLDTDLSLGSAHLYVKDGLALSGRTIFGNGQVTFSGSTTQTLRAGTLGFYDSMANLLENTSSQVARLNSDVVVRGEYLSISGGTLGIINQGTIQSLAPLGSLFASNLLNQGTIEIQTGGVFGTNLAPSNSARIVLNSGLVEFTGPGAQVYGALDNTAAGRVLITAGADATFNGPVSGTAGAEVRVEAGAAAMFNSAVTGPLHFTGDGNVTFGNGASSIGSLGARNLVVQPQATVQADSVASENVTIHGELDIRNTPGGTAANMVKHLIIGPEGVLNLGNNALIVDYDPADGSPGADIRSKILSQRIVGSGTFASAPSIDAAHLALGYAESSKLLGSGGGSFMGQTVDGSAVLVRYTLLGDTNLDGKVDFTDLVKIAQNYGLTSTAEWIDGDSNYDGAVGFADLVALAQNYGGDLVQAPVPGATPAFERDVSAAFAAVPEPGVGVMASLGALTLLQRRKRRRRGGELVRSEGGRHV